LDIPWKFSQLIHLPIIGREIGCQVVEEVT